MGFIRIQPSYFRGKYTYQDDMSPAKMAEVVMENYDVNFASSLKEVLYYLSFGRMIS